VRRPPLAASAVIAVVALLVAITVLAHGDGDRRPGTPLNTVLDDADRRILDAIPIRRGTDPPPADPTVDFTDPVAVARAYLAMARSAIPDDHGRTHLRAAAYAAPGSAAGSVGVVVLDPPPAGQRRTATVTTLDLAAASEDDRRRGYRATVTTATSPSGGAATIAVVPAYVVLARQPDGQWLVDADAPELLEGND
jgi:hypothetical protein